MDNWGTIRPEKASATPYAIPSKAHLLRLAGWIFGTFIVASVYYQIGLGAGLVAGAVLISLLVFVEPRTVLWMSTAFLVCAFLLLPPDPSRALIEAFPQQYYYWAAGLAVVTAALGLALLFSPRGDWTQVKYRLQGKTGVAMLLMFLVVLLSSAYALAAGNEPSYVARQLFGALLLFAYYLFAVRFVKSPQHADQLLKRLKLVIVLGGAYYLGKALLINLGTLPGGLGEGVFYREATAFPFYLGAMGLVAFNQFMSSRTFTQRVKYAGQFLCCVLAVLFHGARSHLGTVAIVSFFVLFAASRKKFLAVLAVSGCMIAGVVTMGPYVINRLTDSPTLVGAVARRFIFSLEEDYSYQGRVLQWQAVMESTKAQPLMGTGLGGKLTSVLPEGGRPVQVAFIDNGWGYLLNRMGLIGLGAFSFLMIAHLGASLRLLAAPKGSRLWVNGVSVATVFMYSLVNFFFGPTFLHFVSASFIGTVMGCVPILLESRTRGAVLKPKQANDLR